MRFQSAVIPRPVHYVTENKTCLWKVIFRGIILLMIVVPILYAGIQYMNAPQNSGMGMGHIQVPLSNLPEGKSKMVLYKGRPVIVINNRGNIKALSALCTKNDSLLHYDNTREDLVCSISGARFDLNGNVTSGLAPRPLERLNLVVGDDSIIIGSRL